MMAERKLDQTIGYKIDCMNVYLNMRIKQAANNG